MKRILIIAGLIAATVIIACSISLLTDKSRYASWAISQEAGSGTGISWAKFEWTSGNLGGKDFDRLSMNIPCTLDGLTGNFTFQFDLGANLTGIYENNFSSLYNLNPAAAHSIKRLRSRLQFWNSNKYFENMGLHFGNYHAINKMAYVFKSYGQATAKANVNDTIHLGTIGADLFKDKVLIIDYPNTRFAICDEVPEDYTNSLTGITLDRNGRAVLPMKLHRKTFRVLFDNGSSIFPLITSAANIPGFSTLPDTDSIPVSSWGKVHQVTGRLIQDSFELAGQQFSNVKIYTNHSGYGIDKETDAMAGNALFWNNTIIIDFRNKRFGVQ